MVAGYDRELALIETQVMGISYDNTSDRELAMMNTSDGKISDGELKWRAGYDGMNNGRFTLQVPA